MSELDNLVILTTVKMKASDVAIECQSCHLVRYGDPTYDAKSLLLCWQCGARRLREAKVTRQKSIDVSVN